MKLSSSYKTRNRQLKRDSTSLLLSLPLNVQQKRPLYLLFLRHPGCPFAEQTVHLVEKAAKRNKSVHCLVILHGEETKARDWLKKVCKETSSDNLMWHFETDRRMHRVWGVSQTGAMHFLGPRALFSLIALLFRGVHNRMATGSRFQSAALFHIDASEKVTSLHKPLHAGDLPIL